MTGAKSALPDAFSAAPDQQKTHADRTEKRAARAVEPAAHDAAREPAREVHAGERVERDGHGFEHEKARAQHAELREHRLRHVDELRQKGRENQNRLRVARRHETLAPGEPRERGVAVELHADGRVVAAPELHGEPHEIGRARELDREEYGFGGAQHDREAGGRERDHRREGQQPAEAAHERAREAVARGHVDRQQVVRPWRHVQREAGGQEKEPGGEGHDRAR
ncbi:hypothetical protein PT2222_100057 [Paraburkholderia tropica]